MAWAGRMAGKPKRKISFRSMEGVRHGLFQNQISAPAVSAEHTDTTGGFNIDRLDDNESQP